MGVIYTIDKQTFINSIKTLHTALYELNKPDDIEQYEILKALIDGYLYLLSCMNITVGKKIQEFLLTHSVLKDEEIEDLFYILAAGPSKYSN